MDFPDKYSRNDSVYALKWCEEVEFRLLVQSARFVQPLIFKLINYLRRIYKVITIYRSSQLQDNGQPSIKRLRHE